MTLHIDAGIGVILVRNEDNLKLQMFLESLKEKIESGGLDKIINYLSDANKEN